jgi:hypothetical protein
MAPYGDGRIGNTRASAWGERVIQISELRSRIGAKKRDPVRGLGELLARPVTPGGYLPHRDFYEYDLTGPPILTTPADPSHRILRQYLL